MKTRTTPHHAAPRRTTPHHAAPRRTTPHHAAPRRTTPHHAAPRRLTAALVLCVWLGASSKGQAQGLVRGNWPLPLYPAENQSPPTEADIALTALMESYQGVEASLRQPGVLASERRQAREALLEDLEGFLKSHPGSRWELSLRVFLGTQYQSEARWSRALPHLSEAWELVQNLKGLEARPVVERLQVALGYALLELGRVEMLETFMRQTTNSPPLDPVRGAAWRAVREGWQQVREHPALPSMMCGAVALSRLAGALGATHPTAAEVLQWGTVADARGFSLARLREIGQRYGLPLQAAVRPAGVAWVYPAVLHWKEDLWRTLLAPEGSGFWLHDPTRGRIWMSARALEEECSGYCLVPAGLLPAHWRGVGPVEAATVVGRSYGRLPQDANDQGCGGPGTKGGPGAPPGGAPRNGPPAPADKKLDLQYAWSTFSDCQSCQNSSPGSAPPSGPCSPSPECGVPSGLPRWWLSEPFINLWLEDEPWGYQPAHGPAVTLGLRYKLRDSTEYQEWIDPWDMRTCDWSYTGMTAGSSFGFGWSSRWFTFVRVRAPYLPDDPELVRLRTPERGFFEVEMTTDQEAAGPLPGTGAFLERSRNEQGVQVGWKLVYPDGHTFAYELEVVPNGLSDLTDYFLSRFEDPQGGSLQFEHAVQDILCEDPNGDPNGNWVHTMVRLTGIRDATGLLSTLAYNHPIHITLITSITDPYGRTARFAYDADGYLTNITDVAGLQTGLQYAEVGQPNPLWLSRLVTPYGTTEFQVAEDRSAWVWLPGGRRLAAEYRGHPNNPYFPADFQANELPQDLPVPQALDDRNRNARNSYFWDMAQAALLSTTNFAELTASDYQLARTRHWLLERDTSNTDCVEGLRCRVGPTLAWEQAPSPDGVQTGAITWYGYDGKVSPCVEGTSSFPSLIARVMPDGSTWYQWMQRNSLGFITNQVERWSDPTGQARFRTNRFVYADNGMDLVAHFGPDGHLVAGYAYDAQHPHLPVARTNAVGEVTRFFYDTAANKHRLLGVAYPSGLASTNYYSGEWLERVVEFLGATPLRTNTFTWLNGRLRTLNDARGFQRTFSYDALGRLTRVDFPDGTFTEQVYTNGAGVELLDPTGVRDRLGNWTRYEYNGLRQLTRMLDPLMRETRFTYCACGGPESITRAWGTSVAETTQYEYDLAGRLHQVIAPDGTAVTNFYDGLGRLIHIAQAFGSRTQYFDNLDRLYRVEDPAGVLAEWLYDDNDRLVSATDSQGVTTTFTYDALGRLLTRTLPAINAVASFGYTTGVTGPTAYTNQLGHVTLYAYDAARRKTNEVQVGVFTNRFTYTPADDLATLTDGKGNVTTWKYDTEGRVTEKWYQGQFTADLLYLYNANGWLTHRFTRTGTGTSTNGYFTTYGYDAVGNLTHVSYPAGTASVTNGFDALNRLTNRLDGLGQTRYTYAVLGNGLHTVTEDGPWAADEVTVTNRFGRRAGLRIAQPAGAFVVTNAWDAAGRWAVVGGTAGTFTYGYPAGSAGRLPVSLTLPGGGFITNTYDDLARLTLTELRSPGGSLLNAHGYQSDAASQRTLLGRTNSAAGSWNGYVLAAYDPAGQLTNAWTYRPDGTAVSSERWSYGYDAAQNLSQRTNNTFVETFTVNALNQLVTLPDGAVQYDRRGNLSLRTFNGSQGYWTWSYDHENRLTGVATDTSYTPESYRWKVEFAYDGVGRLRVRREYTWSYGQWSLSGEGRYLYDGWRLVQERSGANTPTVSYTRGRDLSGGLEGAGGIGGLLARSHGYSGGNWSSHNFYHADGNGNVTALVNSSGTLQASYKYDPYGRLRSQTGPLSNANRLRWSSKPWEGYGPSGLYYYGYRFYDPYLQRWPNRDPIAERGGLNLYGFVGNNPIGRVDTDGRAWWPPSEWPIWPKPKPKPPGQPPKKPKDKCTDCDKQENPAKDLFKTAADTLAGEVGGKTGAMVRLILLAGDAKQGCGDMKGAADTCGDFASDPDQAGCLQCCHAIMNSFPNLGGFSYFQCHAICSKF